MEGLERWQNNQVKKMGIGRLGLIFFMIGGTAPTTHPFFLPNSFAHKRFRELTAFLLAA